MSKCDPTLQREIIKRAIGTPGWKEALSFASHLGLTPLILEVWAELAEGGNIGAANGLSDAIKLVVQAGVPLESDALVGFVQCCWRAVKNTTSRVRYAAGEALCLVSQEHWSLIKEDVLAQLESPDEWNRLVAWACLCASTDQELTIQTLIEVLPNLANSRTSDSYLGGFFFFRPDGNAVWQHLVLGVARRTLVTLPEPEALRMLYGLIGNIEGLSMGTISELKRMFKQAGQGVPGMLDRSWSKHMVRFMPDIEYWNREIIYLLRLIEDSLEVSDEADGVDLVHCFELGACMMAISYWEMPAGEAPSETSSALEDVARRQVIYALARGAGLDLAKLMRQARAMRKRILQDIKVFGFFDLLMVDVEVKLDDYPLIEKQFMPMLEELIVGPSHFFALNAAYILYSMKEDPEYADAVKRVLTRGCGESLRLSAALVKQLPNETAQQFILDRLCEGESTPGCCYLYSSLTAPYGARHLEAIRKGLRGNSAHAAQAAAELVKEFPLDDALARELRTVFDEWQTKEASYLREDGVILKSPRDELAKVLAAAFKQDHDFLLTLLTDERPGVRGAARKHFLAEAAGSAPLRLKLLESTQKGKLKPDIFRAAVSKGFYLNEEAIAVARLLHSENAQLRYAALPILDVKYLQLDQVRNESHRLLLDKELDIREYASRVLRELALLGYESQKI